MTMTSSTIHLPLLVMILVMTNVWSCLAREVGHGHASELRHEQRLGLLECRRERTVHRLLHDAPGALRPIADREDGRLAERLVDVPQRDVLELLAERPPA